VKALEQAQGNQAQVEQPQWEAQVRGINLFEIGMLEGRLVMILGDEQISTGGDRFGIDYAPGKRYVDIDVQRGDLEHGKGPKVLFGKVKRSTDRDLAKGGYARVQDMGMQFKDELLSAEAMLESAARSSEREQVRQLLSKFSEHEQQLLKRVLGEPGKEG